MRTYKYIIQDCLQNKNNTSFDSYFEEFIECDEIIELLNKCKNKEYTKACMELLLKEHLFLKIPPEFKTFKNALFDKINELHNNKKIDYRIKKNKIESKIESLDSYAYNDSSVTLVETIPSADKSSEDIVGDNEKQKFINELLGIGLKAETKPFVIMVHIYEITIDNHFDNLHDLVSSLVNKNFHNEVKELLKHCAKKSKKIRKMFSAFFSFTIYERFIEYLLESNNKKFKIPELIIDFNKIRNYLSVLFYDDSIKDKNSFIKKCDFGSVSSYEKEIHRILSLFKTDKTIFEFKDELKGYTPYHFSKIYDIHTVSNLVSNFLILDVFQKYTSKENEEKEIKLSYIVEMLFPDNSPYIKAKDKNNFRKYNLLPRLKEMEEYGFITINKKHRNKYSFSAKFLNNEQKNALKYVVPFFCGIYPFASIGHFLANRLDIKDVFKFKVYNINNILDDCIAYDLLEAINKKEVIKKLVLKENNLKEDFKPIELFVEKNTGLLKVKDQKDEYYLHEIQEISYSGKVKCPIFSEIYSFYYKIFEEIIKEYKRDKKYDVANTLKKYGTSYTSFLFNRIDKNLLNMLAKLDNTVIPLTILELRWLKTIMQDPRFDIFVTEEEKQCLSVLVEDIEKLDLSSFKIYDYKENKYNNLINKNITTQIKKIKKDDFRKQLSKLNSIEYSLKDNSFKEY